MAKTKTRSDAELKRLALDIHGNLVFTDRHVRAADRESMMGMIFMPLLFLDDKGLAAMKRDKIAVVYEYYSEACPRGINGYPIFKSFKGLTETEWATVSRYLERIDGAMKLV